MSGLPDIGSIGAQVGYSRLAWARLEAWGRPILRDASLRDAPQDEGGESKRITANYGIKCTITVIQTNISASASKSC